MAWDVLGAPVLVVTAGTPVQLTVHQPTNSSPGYRLAAQAVFIQALPTNTGKIYVGIKGMVVSTLTNIRAIIGAPSSSTVTPPFSTAGLPTIAGGINLADIYIDADNDTDGVIASFTAG